MLSLESCRAHSILSSFQLQPLWLRTLTRWSPYNRSWVRAPLNPLLGVHSPSYWTSRIGQSEVINSYSHRPQKRVRSACLKMRFEMSFKWARNYRKIFEKYISKKSSVINTSTVLYPFWVMWLNVVIWLRTKSIDLWLHVKRRRHSSTAIVQNLILRKYHY